MTIFRGVFFRLILCIVLCYVGLVTTLMSVDRAGAKSIMTRFLHCHGQRYSLLTSPGNVGAHWSIRALSQVVLVLEWVSEWLLQTNSYITHPHVQMHDSVHKVFYDSESSPIYEYIIA